MPARKAPSKGSKPDKLMRDAIILSLHREAQDADGQNTKRLNIIATKLVDLAMGGDMAAIKEVNDRVDGKAPQAIVGEDDKPLTMVHRIERAIVSANPAD